MKSRAGLSCGVALCALLAAAGGAMATDFVVPAGPAVGQQVLPGLGDTLLIETGGSIVTVAIPGVSMNNIDQIVTNDGLVTTSGDFAYGILSAGADAQIGNSGGITTSGDAARGILSTGADARIGNSGDITTSGEYGYGILSAGADAQIGNSGDIETSGYGARGIFSTGVNARIGNSGDITTWDDHAYGINSDGAGARIDNSGGITTSGDYAYGIISAGADARIDNSGHITTSGLRGYGIFSTGADAWIDNSGDITTSSSLASGIYSLGANAQIGNNGHITTSVNAAYGIVSGGADAQIDNRGGITTLYDNADGIYSLGANAQIGNSGDITTFGFRAYGIYSLGANAQIGNSGHITTWGFFSEGITSFGANAEIANSGGIRTWNEYAYGINSQGAGAWIDNSGDITTFDVGAYGIFSHGADAEIDNSGDITTSGENAAGILSTNARIDNSGKITTSGAFGHGIWSANSRIDNSGDITTSGVGAYGIWSGGADATVTNSGRVVSEQSFAMVFEGGNATLSLLAGSAIQGGIRFVSPGNATLNIGPGLNTALTFDGLPETRNSFGAPMVVQGSLVAVVDPTGFSAQDEMLTDLTRAISGAVDGRLNAARFGYVPVTSSITAYVEPEAHAAELGYGTGSEANASQGSGFWAAGIGTYRTQDADGPNVGFDTTLAGLLVGYDAQVSGGTKVGGFLGASTSRFETDANSQEIDADSYYGGVYAGFTGASYFLDVSVTGGVSRQSSDRSVANNLVIGGIEHAKADYDGVFVSPSATIGTTYALVSGNSLIPSFRARYAGLFLDGYDESGSAADLSVDDRDVNVFDFRAQLAYALAAKPLDNGSFHTAFRFGADATFADNEDVEAALLGEALNFSVSGDDTVRGFAGFDLIHRTEAGSSYFLGAEAGYDSYFLGAEAGYDSGDAFTLDVRGGLQVPL